MSETVHSGGCLCGGVRYRVRGALDPVVDCHCRQCRRIHGHVAAFTAAPRTQIEFVADEGLRWYGSSPGIRRGFCGTCGSSLFWDEAAAARTSIAAGTLDGPTGLRTVGHIYVADSGDYYVIDDGLPRFPAGDDGALLARGTA